MVKDISISKSVGQAQLIGALNKQLKETQSAKEGPTFIYTYVPLSKEQEQAENIVILEEDPFIPRG